MYSDNEKNLMMFLPDNVSEQEIMSLGEVVFPEDDGNEFFLSSIKPIGCINLYDLHASYPIDSIFPDSIFPPSL